MPDKLCPFCGQPPRHTKRGGMVVCLNPECPIYEVAITLEDWQNRPAEDEARADEVLQQFEQHRKEKP